MDKTIWRPGLCPWPCWRSLQRSPDHLTDGD